MSRPVQTRPYDLDVTRRLGAKPRVYISGLALLLVTAGLVSLPAFAQTSAAATVSGTQLPTGGQVNAGQASISQSGNTLNINQTSQRAVVDWSTFNVGKDATVNFQQPNAQAATLNRVADTQPSQILGRITAPGQVVLVNPQGVYFGKSSSVDVGGLVATTHNTSNQEFMEGQIKLSRNGATGKVDNEGELRAALGGYIALLAPEVRNSGVIVANLGTVAMAAGESFELKFEGSGALSRVIVSAATINTLVENKNAVRAPGGLIILSAKSASRLQSGVVNNSGMVEAAGLVRRAGRILLEASTSILNSGTLQVPASLGTDAGPAGTISLSAPDVQNSGTLSATNLAANFFPDASGLAAEIGRISIQADTFTQTDTGLLDVSAVAQQAGFVDIVAAQAMGMSGRVFANGIVNNPSQIVANALGGHIHLQASRRVDLTTAVLDASGEGGAGRIHIQADGLPAVPADPANHTPAQAPVPGAVLLSTNTVLRANSARAQAGRVEVEGDDISLDTGTRIEATGATGGGTVLVGGGWQGSGPLRQATTVTMSADSSIDASATDFGNGGEVVMWSDVMRLDSVTTVQGRIYAKGGTYSGAGGKVETSAGTLKTHGIFVDTRAADGTAGEWLLDPWNLVIGATGANEIANNLLTSNVTISTTARPSITLSGEGNCTDCGDFILNAPITYTGADYRRLTLQAHSYINLSGSITSTNGKLDTIIWSNYTNVGGLGVGGYTWVAPNVTIDTKGGLIVLAGGNDDGGNGGVANDGIPDGYAWNKKSAMGGVQLGNPGVAGGSINLLSGGGDIVIRGKTSSVQAAGVVSQGTFKIDAGVGRVVIEGVSDSDHGLFLAQGSSNADYVIRSAYSGGSPAITISGTSNQSGYGGNILSWNSGQYLIESTSTSGGGISIQGSNSTAQGTNVILDLNAGSTDYLLSRNGAISITGNGGNSNLTSKGTLRLGSLASPVTVNGVSSTVSTSTSSVSMTDAGLSLNVIAINTSSGLSVTHTGNSAITGVISGAGAFSKAGAGRLDLTGVNTYTGNTTVSAGTLGLYTNTAAGTGSITAAGGTKFMFGRAVSTLANNFTLNGSVTFELDTAVDYLIVAGGGGGGGGGWGGGGGAGGFVSGSTQLSPGTYAVTVGTGGSGGGVGATASNGGNSSLGALTVAIGGGGGAGYGWNNGYVASGNPGGSGGGTAEDNQVTSGGAGTAGQGNSGGGSATNGVQAGGGGGGAGSAGGSVPSSSFAGDRQPGSGGSGRASDITGTSTMYAGGGGGATAEPGPGRSCGMGGSGGGGAGACNGSNPVAGTVNTGGGGGGGQSGNGASGGSGVVIARYLGSAAGTGGSPLPGSGSATGYTLHTFNSSGSLSLDAINVVLSGNIGGTGAMVANATGGKFNLTGTNSYSGNTTIGGGTFQIGGSGSLGTGSYAGTIANAGAFLYSSTVDQILSGAISGTGSLTKDTGTSSTLTLSATNTYSGATTLGAGTLKLSGKIYCSTATCNVDQNSAAIVTVKSGTTLELTDWGFYGSLGSNYFDKTNIVIDGGTIKYSGLSHTSGARGFTVTANGATFENASSNTTWTLTGSAHDPYKPAFSGNVSFTGAGSFSFEHLISGTGITVTKNGAGKLTLSGANTYTGATTVNAGTLSAASSTALGTTAAGTTLADGASLELQGNITVADAISLTGSGVSGAGALRNLSGSNALTGLVTMTGSAKIQSDAGTLSLSPSSGNAITGNYNLSFDGVGNTTVAGPI
ncbi:MAG: hypothetical protein RLZZ498_212, partial [Pseudomonadota bacterium]